MVLSIDAPPQATMRQKSVVAVKDIREDISLNIIRNADIDDCNSTCDLSPFAHSIRIGRFWGDHRGGAYLLDATFPISLVNVSAAMTHRLLGLPREVEGVGSGLTRFVSE